MKSGYDRFFKEARKQEAKKEHPSKQDNRGHRSRLRFSDRQSAQQTKHDKSISWKLAGLSFIGLLIAAIGVFYYEDVEQMIKKVEITALGQALAQTNPQSPGQASNEIASETKSGQEAQKKEAHKEKTEAQFSQEDLAHFMKLNERKKELDAREEELNRMDEDLHNKRLEIEKKIADLEKMRQEIASTLGERVKTDEKRVDELVLLYTNMRPAQAAKVFETMDESLAIEIIGKMKKKNAAEILNLLKAEKAQGLSEKYAGYKR